MHRIALTAALLVAAGALATAAGAAPVAVPDSTATYVLRGLPSAIETGCQGPCECPVVETPSYGSFVLVFTHSDPLYDYFALTNYITSPNTGPGYVNAVGSGTYKIGGEFALTQQMTLDLAIEGRPVQHFDSGVVPVGATFPAISVRCPAHGFACVDTVVDVSASPVGVAGVGAPARGPGSIVALWPNPCAAQARIAFAMRRATRVDLAVVDARGRRVRTLLAGALAGPGEQVATWDGRDDAGRAAPAGVYWARLAWPGGSDRRAIVRLAGAR